MKDYYACQIYTGEWAVKNVRHTIVCVCRSDVDGLTAKENALRIVELLNEK